LVTVASFPVGALPNDLIVNDTVSRVSVSVGFFVIRSADPGAITTAEGRRKTRGSGGGFTRTDSRRHSGRFGRVVCGRHGGEENGNIGRGFGEATTKEGPPVLNTRCDGFGSGFCIDFSAFLSLGTFPNVLVRVIHECPRTSCVILRDIGGVPPGDWGGPGASLDGDSFAIRIDGDLGRKDGGLVDRRAGDHGERVRVEIHGVDGGRKIEDAGSDVVGGEEKGRGDGGERKGAFAQRARASPLFSSGTKGAKAARMKDHVE